MPAMTHEDWLREAMRLAIAGVEVGRGGPFGSVVVRDGAVLGRGENRVLSTNDPTAHAEIVALREACQEARSFHLPGAVVYASCEPCPMCLAALYWARVARVYYAASCQTAAQAGFADDFIRRELPLPSEQRSLPVAQLLASEGGAPFDAWLAKQDRTMY